MRRRFARNRRVSGDPVVLLPSAYVNVSRTAASYAALLPDDKFLMVYARNSARMETLPSNVATTSLDAYFVPPDPVKRPSSDEERGSRFRLVWSTAAEEYSVANEMGMLERIPGLLRWGIAVRRRLESGLRVGKYCGMFVRRRQQSLYASAFDSRQEPWNSNRGLSSWSDGFEDGGEDFTCRHLSGQR